MDCTQQNQPARSMSFTAKQKLTEEAQPEGDPFFLKWKSQINTSPERTSSPRRKRAISLQNKTCEIRIQLKKEGKAKQPKQINTVLLNLEKSSSPIKQKFLNKWSPSKPKHKLPDTLPFREEPYPNVRSVQTLNKTCSQFLQRLKYKDYSSTHNISQLNRIISSEVYFKIRTINKGHNMGTVYDSQG